MWTPRWIRPRGLLVQSGWKQTATERFVNAEKFAGVWADFVKDDEVAGSP